ncbi:hypothetical protein KAJ27_12740 [bacterium]|nr:hypothetical protein [bacterium]
MIKKNVVLIIFLFFLYSPIFSAEDKFHDFFKHKEIDSVFTFIKNRIKPSPHFGIKYSPSKVFWNDSGNYLEKLNLLGSVFKKRNIIFRWRRLILTDEVLRNRFNAKYSGLTDEYFILEIKHDGKWKPVDLFFSDDFFEFKYYGKKDKYFFRLPPKYYWHVETKIFLTSQRYFKDLLNLKETHPEQITIYARRKKIIDSMEDYCKASFIKNDIFKGKMLVSVCTEEKSEVLEIDHYYKKKPFREVQAVELQKINFELKIFEPEGAGKPVAGSQEKKYILSDEIKRNNSYTFFYVSELSETGCLNDDSAFVKIFEKLKILGFLRNLESSVHDIKLIINRIHSLSIPLIKRWVIPFFEIYQQFQKKIFRFLPVVVKEYERGEKKEVDIFFWRNFIYGYDSDSLQLSLLDNYLSGNVNMDLGIKCYFFQDLLDKNSTFLKNNKSILEQIVNGNLVVSFITGKWFFIKLGYGNNYKIRETDRKTGFLQYFTYDYSKKGSIISGLESLVSGYTGNKLPGIEMKIDSEGMIKKTIAMKKMIVEMSFEKILFGIQQEKKYSEFYKEQRYGLFHSMVLDSSIYFPGKEKEYLKNLAEFYRKYK